ncbi:MAG: hypothetical protein JRN67_08895, partial [Nitrososphaerota archaeon]|nr:hypothetical protein [Nitrososphaerota archaeon]
MHIPAGQQADKIHSMTWGTASISPRISSIKNGIDTAPEKKVSILQTNELPRWEEGPDESIVARLALLASDTERSFELVYQSGEMSVLLSSKTSEDLSKYRN